MIFFILSTLVLALAVGYVCDCVKEMLVVYSTFIFGIILGCLYYEGKDYKQKIQVVDDTTSFMPSYRIITNSGIQSIILVYSNYPR